MRSAIVGLIWSVLLVATCLSAWGAWILVDREASRSGAIASDLLQSRTETVASNLDFVVEDILSSVEGAFPQLSMVSEETLRQIILYHPYVAGAFYQLEDGAMTILGDASDWADSFDRSGPEKVLPSIAEEPHQSQQAKAEINSEGDAIDRSEAAPVSRNKVRSSNQVALRKQRSAIQSIQQTFSRSEPYRRETAIQADAFAIDSSEDQRTRENEAVASISSERVQPESLQAESFAMAVPVEVDIEAPDLQFVWKRYTQSFEEALVLEQRDEKKQKAVGLLLDRASLISELKRSLSYLQAPPIHFGLSDSENEAINGGEARQIIGSDAFILAEEVALSGLLANWRLKTYEPVGLRKNEATVRLLGGAFIGILGLAVLFGSALILWIASKETKEARRKTTFVANVSHELKTPLTSIQLFAEMLAGDRVADPNKRQNYLQQLQKEAQRLGRLVNQVLDFNKGDKGRTNPIKVEAVHLSEFIDVVYADYSAKFENVGSQLRIERSAKDLTVVTNEDALRQITINLLDNALKYSAAYGFVTLALNKDIDQWTLSVEDGGPGIRRRDRKQIFEAFTRADVALTAQTQGLGLGLSIAAERARELGGSLVCKMNSRGGSTFTFLGPLSE